MFWADLWYRDQSDRYESLPRAIFSLLLGWNLSILLLVFLEVLACGAGLAYLDDHGLEPWKGKMLPKGGFSARLPWMTELFVVPFDAFRLKWFRDDNLAIFIHD